MVARIIKAHIFPEPKAGETDDISRGMDNFAIIRKSTVIIVLLCNFKSRNFLNNADR